jgi:hypothetical protein
MSHEDALEIDRLYLALEKSEINRIVTICDNPSEREVREALTPEGLKKVRKIIRKDIKGQIAELSNKHLNE